MCRRCVIQKGRAVGKSTDLGNSLAIVLAHDKCIRLVPVDPKTMKKVREGKFKDVSMSSHFVPGKTVKEIPLGKLTEESRVALGMAAHGYIHQRLHEITDPKNRPSLKEVTRRSFKSFLKPGAFECTCGEDDDDGPPLPHKTWCPKASEAMPETEKPERDRSVLTSEDPECKPDWNTPCEVCGAVPTLPVTGMCGPCTFGEAETAGGNW